MGYKTKLRLALAMADEDIGREKIQGLLDISKRTYYRYMEQGRTSD